YCANVVNSNVSRLAFISWFAFLMPVEDLLFCWEIISASDIPSKETLTLASGILKQGMPTPTPGTGNWKFP
ncbi:hypothetical protein ACQP3L_38225, partial [Escherichia coli]